MVWSRKSSILSSTSSPLDNPVWGVVESYTILGYFDRGITKVRACYHVVEKGVPDLRSWWKGHAQHGHQKQSEKSVIVVLKNGKDSKDIRSPQVLPLRQLLLSVQKYAPGWTYTASSREFPPISSSSVTLIDCINYVHNSCPASTTSARAPSSLLDPGQVWHNQKWPWPLQNQEHDRRRRASDLREHPEILRLSYW